MAINLGEKPSNLGDFESILPLFRAWPNSLVFGHVCSPAEDTKPAFKASSVWAIRLSVRFCPFRGVTPTVAPGIQANLSFGGRESAEAIIQRTSLSSGQRHW